MSRGGPVHGRRHAIASGLGLAFGVARATEGSAPPERAGALQRLPLPVRGAPPSLQAALQQRRSIRDFSDASLSMAQLSALLWAGQGVSNERGLRTAPSAGALYPLELLVVARRVQGLSAGLFRYVSAAHAIERLEEPGLPDLSLAAHDQAAISGAPAVLAIAARTAVTAARYGARAPRYVAIEAGAAAQNIALLATTLGLGSVIVGAFDDELVRRALRLPDAVQPMALMPVGVPA